MLIELNNQERPYKIVWSESQIPKSVVLIAPAMGITSKYYQHLATWLSTEGHHVAVLDYEGTGHSLIGKLKDCKADLFDWVKNIETAGDFLKQRYPDLPLCFLGHSLGSQLFGFVRNQGHFEQAVFIASSTGYLRDGHTPKRFLNYFLLAHIIPLSNALWSYTNAKLFGRGDNYPKFAATQWRKWCLSKDYLLVDMPDTPHINFRTYKGKLVSIWFSDDPIANENTSRKLKDLFGSASKRLIKITPEEYHVNKIGHTGFLSRRFQESLWPKIAKHLS